MAYISRRGFIAGLLPRLRYSFLARTGIHTRRAHDRRRRRSRASRWRARDTAFFLHQIKRRLSAYRADCMSRISSVHIEINRNRLASCPLVITNPLCTTGRNGENEQSVRYTSDIESPYGPGRIFPRGGRRTRIYSYLRG